MGSIIAKCGYTQTTASALIYAPTELGGAGFISWYSLQGVGQVQLFLKHWRTNSPISKVLCIDVAWSKWQEGFGHSILGEPQVSLPWLECRWLRSLPNFLAHCDGRIHLDHSFVVQPEREGDIFIMEYAQQCRLFNTAELRFINYCQLYLHITTVSELFNTAGTAMLPHMFQCRPSPWRRPDHFITRQQRPSTYQITKRWQPLCCEFCLEDGTITMSISLGAWTNRPAGRFQRRESYYVPGIWPIIYHWHDGAYWECHPLATRPGNFLLITATNWTPTIDDTPVDVFLITEHSVRVPTFPQCTSPIPTPALLHDFDNYLHCLPQWEQDLLQGVQFHKSPFALLDHLQRLPSNQTVLLVSNGGSRKRQGMSFGLVLGTDDGTILVEHSGPAFGEPTSSRAEGTGQLVSVLLLFHITFPRKSAPKLRQI